MKKDSKTQKIARTTFVLVLSALLTVTVLPLGRTDATSLSGLKSQYSALQKQQKEIKSQISDLNSKINLGSQKADAINENINAIEKQISLLNSQVKLLNSQLKSKNEDIAETQKKVESNKKLLKQQICAMYETGSNSRLEILLTSKSLSDVFNRLDALNSITEYDNKLINELEQDQKQLAADKKSIESDINSIESSQGSLDAKKAILNNQRQQQKAIIEQLKNNVKSAKSKSAQVTEQAAQTDAQINAEIAKEAAARRKQLASKSSSGTKSSGQTYGNGGGSVSSSSIVSYAESFIGCSYVFGSAGPRTFDCSGFVQYVFANEAGITLKEHSAQWMYGCGTYVSKDNLQPGDLVFFGSSTSSISHVGIYVGGGKMVNAANKRQGVCISSISSFHPKYVGARRIS